ncbi:hypothetical protein BDZ89DRAFT_1061711 [Hymenopellis radicata]|nr:hypothetical protein BDZ89DRAFT_1061711 [Hymenopellis radicata]
MTKEERKADAAVVVGVTEEAYRNDLPGFMPSVAAEVNAVRLDVMMVVVVDLSRFQIAR